MESLARDPDGHLRLDGISLSSLVQSNGSPLFVFSQRLIRGRYQELMRKLTDVYDPATIFYSVKTNYLQRICEIYASMESGAEVASAAELEVAVRSGFQPHKTIYDGAYKPKSDLKVAMTRGIGLINIETLDEMKIINGVAAELGVVQPIGLRVNLVRTSRYGWARPWSHSFRWGYPDVRFGLQLDELDSAVNLVDKCSNVRIEGLLFHPFPRSLDFVIRVVQNMRNMRRVSISVINLGGGFPVSTVKPLSGFTPILRRFQRKCSETIHEQNLIAAEVIPESAVQALRSVAPVIRREGQPTVALEPGRVLVGPAGLILLTVTNIRRAGGTLWVQVDGGVHLIPWGASERHRILVANRPTHSYMQATLVGPTLDPSDLIAVRECIPRCEVGDILAYLDAGAYSFSLARRFIFPRPAAVLVGTHGAEPILRREDSVAFASQAA